MTNRVLLGRDGSTFVLKVSKPGVDVLANPPIEDLLFSTELEGFGEMLFNTVVSAAANSTTTVSFPNLDSSYSPVFSNLHPETFTISSTTYTELTSFLTNNVSEIYLEYNAGAQQLDIRNSTSSVINVRVIGIMIDES